MVFEDFIEQLFTSIKSSNGALTCFVYVDGEELLNTTCLFKDVLSDAVSCADRLSLAIDPVVGQAVRENKSVSLMAVVSFGDNDEVYRFRSADGELVCRQSLFEKNHLHSIKEFIDSRNNIKSIEERAIVPDELKELMKANGVIENKERYNKRLSVLKQIHCGKPVEHTELNRLFNEYTKTFF